MEIESLLRGSAENVGRRNGDGRILNRVVNGKAERVAGVHGDPLSAERIDQFGARGVDRRLEVVCAGVLNDARKTQKLRRGNFRNGHGQGGGIGGKFKFLVLSAIPEPGFSIDGQRGRRGKGCRIEHGVGAKSKSGIHSQVQRLRGERIEGKRR